MEYITLLKPYPTANKNKIVVILVPIRWRHMSVAEYHFLVVASFAQDNSELNGHLRWESIGKWLWCCHVITDHIIIPIHDHFHRHHHHHHYQSMLSQQLKTSL